MIVNKYIPTTFNDIVNQDISKKVLMTIADSPYNSPNIIVISGSKGLGKTTLSKLFAKALNCEYKKSKDCCGLCCNCTDIRPFYNEFNGNEFVRPSIIEDITKLSNNEVVTRVISIEEADLIPQDKQIELLNIIEKSVNTFFVFITEDITKIVNPIKSRGMHVETTLIEEKKFKEYIQNIIDNEQITIDPETKDKILIRSGGNISYCLTLLDKYVLLGEELFNEYLSSTRINLIKFLAASFMQDKDKAELALTDLMKSPVSIIKQDYELLILELMKLKTRLINGSDKFIKALYNICTNRVLDLFNLMNDRIMYDMFDNEVNLQSALWYMYVQIGELVKR